VLTLPAEEYSGYAYSESVRMEFSSTRKLSRSISSWRSSAERLEDRVRGSIDWASAHYRTKRQNCWTFLCSTQHARFWQTRNGSGQVANFLIGNQGTYFLIGKTPGQNSIKTRVGRDPGEPGYRDYQPVVSSRFRCLGIADLLTDLTDIRGFRF
jgi:hypothetical protein